MEHCMTLKVIIPKAKQVAANAALQAVGVDSYEEWATSVEGMLMERKAYVKDVRTRYKEFSKTNGAYIFHMEFIGTEGQLFNIFHTPGLVDALKLITSYCAWHEMYLPTKSASYFILYGNDGPMDINLPPLALATPRPGPAVPSAPARSVSPTSVSEQHCVSAPVSTTPNPFTEPMPRMIPVVEPVSTATVITTPCVERLLVDSEDSILTLNVVIPYSTESIKDYATSEWVHFYDEVALPVGKKSYDICEDAVGVILKATFRTHVDKYADVFTEEALHHLEEAVYHAKDDIFYVEMPVKNEHDGKTYYVKNYSEFILVGGFFHWSFGGVEGGDVKVEVSPAQEVLPPIQVAEVIPPPSPKDKAAQRVAELKANAEAIRAEVSELKKARTKLNSEINEKEARIRAFDFACDELRDVFGF